MSKIFNIYVDTDRVYSGTFNEVPTEHRDKIVEALDEWGEILGKSGLNEMIYSLFFWYNEKEFYCEKCDAKFKDLATCSDCGQELSELKKHEQNEKIDNLLNSVGMLTHLEIK